MNTEQIVEDWLSNHDNRKRLPYIVYEKAVYDYIKSTCSKRSYDESDYLESEPDGNKHMFSIYEVNGIWQHIILKK